MRNRFDVVIVGGGVAGLACARELVERGNRDFVLITEEIGGRLATSSDGQINYGAFYVRKDYEHILKYVSLKRRVCVTQMGSFERSAVRGLLNFRNWLHAPRLLQFRNFLGRFHRHEVRLRKNAERMSQRRALLRDPWLMSIYQKPATELIQELRIQHWVDHFLNALVWSTVFQDFSRVSAAYFAEICLPLLIPIYEFEFQQSRLVDPFRSQIKIDRVIGVLADGEGWNVRCANGQELCANHVAIATPISVAKRLIPIPEPTNPAVSIYLFHVEGTLHARFRRRPFLLLAPELDGLTIVREPDDTCLFYSRDPDPDLSVYFADHRVIARRHWDPAFFVGTEIVESDRGDGLYLIGDYNGCGLERAFVTGLYAAGKIVARDGATLCRQ